MKGWATDGTDETRIFVCFPNLQFEKQPKNPCLIRAIRGPSRSIFLSTFN